MIEKFGKGVSYARDICKYTQENANEEIIKEILNTIEKVKEYFK